MTRTFLVALTTICFLNGLSAQTYDYTWKEHKYHFLGSVALFAGSQIYAQRPDNELIDDLTNLDRSKLWRIDIGAIRNDSKSADRLSDITLYSSVALPILLTLGKSDVKGTKLSIAAMGLQGFLLENGLNSFTKAFAERPRPFVYRNSSIGVLSEIDKNSSSSFYSGHASTSAYLCFFGARVFADTHPDSKWKPVVWGIAATLPALTGYLRVQAGKHFATDVIVGYAVGAAIGNFLPKLYRNDNVNLSVTYGGLQLNAKF